jgi:hypothetical protein
MLSRRLLFGLALVPALAPRAGAAPRDIRFLVQREGSDIGTHTVRFREEGGLLRARTEMRIEVKLLSFTVYRFSQDTEEAWRGERLVGLESRSDRNGTRGFCRAAAEAAGLRLRGTAGEALVAADAVPLTWWREASLAGDVPLFDVREGRVVAPRLVRSPAGGGQRIRVIGGEGAEVLYDAAGNWIGFATTGEDGSAVSYRRT